jgi:hypothetical protein
MEYQFEGIPTVPPRKDTEHFAFFCDGCRYRRVNRHGGLCSHCALSLLAHGPGSRAACTTQQLLSSSASGRAAAAGATR